MPNREPLRRIVISYDLDDAGLQTFIDRFPDISFVSVGADEVESVLGDADAALLGSVSPSLIANDATSLRWIQVPGAGVERLTADVFPSDRLMLTNGSGVMADNMAEHAIGMMLGFARRFPVHFEANRRHAWNRDVARENVFELGGQTIVLVGLGEVGLSIAVRLQGFGMKVIGVRRSQVDESPPHVDRVVTQDELKDVLGLAHHVISSVPHTPGTEKMFDGDTFAQFRPGAYFYNMGRGSAVDQPSLIAALESGHLAGAGLDVTTPEPLPEDDPLWDAPNVFITGHTSGATPFFRSRVMDLFADNIERYQRGDDLVNRVDVSRGY